VNEPSTTCVFCQIIAGKAVASMVYQDELTAAFVDLRQANPGHVLVVPKQHLNDIRELDTVTGSALMSTLVKITKAVDVAFPNDGFSVWHSIGPSAFQEVPHLHLHIHPRLPNDDLLRIYPSKPVDVEQDIRDVYAQRIIEKISLWP
jgi:histidine triad (HIT) family protein